MTRTLRAALTSTLVLFAALPLAGCEEKVTRANFDSIRTSDPAKKVEGMTMSEVETVMGGKGEQETVMGGGISGAGIGSTEVTKTDIYKWEHGQKWISVRFVNGKAVEKNKSPQVN
jgi:hypothetical protein